MSGDGSDEPGAGSTAKGGLGRAVAKLRARLESEPLRAAVYFVLGAIAASVVTLIWATSDLTTLADNENGPRRVDTAFIDPLSGAAAQALTDIYPFHWHDRVGVLFRAAVDAGSFRQYAAEQTARIDRIRIERSAATVARIRADLRPVLDGMQDRVTDYGDWMYNWWTAWILLGQAFGWTWQGLMDGDIRTLPDAVQTRLTAEIRDKYNTIVLRSEVLEPQIQALIDRAVAGVQRDVVRVCADNDNALRAFVGQRAQRIERWDPQTGWAAVARPDDLTAQIASTCQDFGSQDQSTLVDLLLADRPMSGIDARINDVIIRLSRPFATKLISFMVLPVVTTALAGGVAVPFLGLPAGALAGLLAGGAVGALVIGFSSSAAVDWLLTRTDEAFSRDSFEANLRDAVKTATLKFEARVTVTTEQYVDRQYQKILATMLGRGP